MRSPDGTSSSGPEHVRVLVVDDHDVFRRGIARMLACEGIDIVGEASGGRAGVRLTSELRPEVVLMDLSMPDLDGLAATRQIIASGCGARIVVLTISDQDESIIQALVAGAVGYVRKDESLKDIVTVVRAAAAGDAIIPPRVGSMVLDRLRKEEPATSEDGSIPQLSKRELEVLRLMVDGKDNATIAAELFISPNTVKNHLANIFEKLGVANRLQASVQALRRGIIS
jgi:DNA-binding NarL/FixJ family response regulator